MKDIELLEKELLEIKDLRWLPFVGENYENKSPRVLVVGESHYVNEPEKRENFFNNPESTRIHAIEQGLNNLYNEKVHFYSNLHRLIVPNGDINTKSLWSKISFYNFIQNSLMSEADDRPPRVDFINSCKPFFEVLEKLSPDYCLMCGMASFDQISKNVDKAKFEKKLVMGAKQYPKISNVYPRKIVLETIQGKLITLVFIQHPSRYFPYSNWNTFLVTNFPEMMELFEDLR